MMSGVGPSVRRSTEVIVDLPAEQAIELFTAEGERRWADGWDPQYPDPARREGPGAVFTTGHGSHPTTWITIDQGPSSVGYARVTHGLTAGTVEVELVESRENSTRWRVTYDLTSLTPAGASWLEHFDSHFETEIGGWSGEIAAALKRSGPQAS